MFALFLNGIFDSMKAFITAQKHFKIIYQIQTITFTLHLFWSWFFISLLGLGIPGAAYARTCEEILNVGLVYRYIKSQDDFKKTWRFTREGFKPSLIWK